MSEELENAKVVVVITQTRPQTKPQGILKIVREIIKNKLTITADNKTSSMYSLKNAETRILHKGWWYLRIEFHSPIESNSITAILQKTCLHLNKPKSIAIASTSDSKFRFVFKPCN